MRLRLSKHGTPSSTPRRAVTDAGRRAGGHAHRSKLAVGVGLAVLATLAVGLVVTLERPGAPRTLGPPVTVDHRIVRDSSSPDGTRRSRPSRERSRAERPRRSSRSSGNATRTRESSTSPDHGSVSRERSSTTAPRTPVSPPSSGARPVESPNAPAAGGDDDEADTDDEPGEGSGSCDHDGDEADSC